VAQTKGKRTWRLLVAEDELISRTLLTRLVSSWGYDVIAVEDGSQALEVLEGDDPPRLAVLDWMMPGADGVAICRRIRALRREPYIYLIILTALQERQKLVEALEAGADDFLTKPVQPHELELRIHVGRRIVELEEQLIEAREALRELATHDPLTRIWNRRAILEILEKEIARASRKGASADVCALMIDIDHFKTVNDQYGHLVGDQVLMHVAERIREAVRRHDEVGRYGGEEFLAVLTGCGVNGLKAVAERIRKEVAENPFVTGDRPIAVTVSLGGARLTGGEGGGSIMQLIGRADHALYEAKDQGRNRVVIDGEQGVNDEE